MLNLRLRETVVRPEYERASYQAECHRCHVVVQLGFAGPTDAYVLGIRDAGRGQD
jgi:hypothetical protein